MLDILSKSVNRSGGDLEAMIRALNKSQAVIHFKMDGTILDANENFLSAMGYSLDEIKGKHHGLFVEPGYRESAEYQEFWARLRNGEFQTAEYKRMGKDGREIWIQASYNPIMGPDGTPKKVVKFATDITEAKRRNAEYEGQLTALDKSQAVIHFDLDGTIVEANQNFLDAVGYKKEEIAGQHHRLFVEEEYRKSDEYKEFWRALGRGEFKSGEFKRIGKGGKEIWLQASYNPIFDPSGNPTKVVKFASDITEEKLRNADFTGQIDAINKSQAVIHFELDGTIIDANENFCSAMGYSLEEIRDKHHSMFVEPEYAQSKDYKAFWQALGRGEFQAAEYKRFGKNGTEIWIQASYNPILDPSGKPFRVVKFATDITDAMVARQEAERVGKLVDEKLEQIISAVTEASRQSSSANEASARTSETVQTVASAAEEFSASVSEVSQSMANSKAAVDQAMGEVAAADQATQELSTAAESMNNIVSLIQDIAAQINLLSLNATIESARAGEAGKGFAVVASEVKNLANEVATATGQISKEIESMQTVSGDVVRRLQSIQQQVDSVQSSVTGVAGAVEEQSAATREISSNLQAAASAVSSVDESLGEIVSSIEAASGSAKEGIEMYRSLQRKAS